LYFVPLTLIQAIDNDNKCGRFEVKSSRMQALERFDNKLGQLDINRLMKDEGILVDGCRNKLA